MHNVDLLESQIRTGEIAGVMSSVFCVFKLEFLFLEKGSYTSIIPLSVNIIHLHSEGEFISNWTERQAAHPFVFGECPLNSLQARSRVLVKPALGVSVCCPQGPIAEGDLSQP